jgi:hypothetical protein
MLKALRSTLRCLWALQLLRDKAQISGQSPNPLTWAYLTDLAWNIGSAPAASITIKQQVELCFAHTMDRLKGLRMPVACNFIIDELLAVHGLLDSHHFESTPQ